MKIRYATTAKEQQNLDQLLWDVLWKPLGLPRNIRKSFELDKPQIDLISVEDNTIIGALVANWLSEKEIEIRHIAVRQDFQGLSVARLLIDELIELVKKKSPLQIQTLARNTSVGFFAKLGFESRGSPVRHKDFLEHGITFQRVFINIPKNTS